MVCVEPGKKNGEDKIWKFISYFKYLFFWFLCQDSNNAPSQFFVFISENWIYPLNDIKRKSHPPTGRWLINLQLLTDFITQKNYETIVINYV